MFETVLVPLDGSTLAESALPIALEIKSKFGSRLLLVRSVEMPIPPVVPGIFESPAAAAANVEMMQRMIAAERTEAESYLASQLQRLGGSQDIETVVPEGDAAHAIAQLATERDAGLIVISSHGRGGLAKLVHGSVADAVLRGSKVPVLLVRPTGDRT